MKFLIMRWLLLRREIISFSFREVGNLDHHFAIIGIAAGIADYPLYYDAINEKGLGMAGLNFSGYADYKKLKKEKKMFLHLSLFLGYWANALL